MRVLYATNNIGKINEVKKQLEKSEINLVSPKDLGIELEVEESGKTLEENATLKAEAFAKLPQTQGMIIMADDTGVEIDALNGEPGVHVNRWKDHKNRMSDEEIIAYCLERMKDVPKGKREAQFKTVIALVNPANGNVETFNGVLRGEIVQSPVTAKNPGLPFNSLMYIPEYGMMMVDIHALSAEEKAKYPTHRVKAVQKALKRIKSFLK